MPLTIKLYSLVVFVCGLFVFFNAWRHIKYVFSKNTPVLICLGAISVAVGALFILADPLKWGGLVVIGQAALILGERRSNSIFARNAGGRQT